MNSIWIAVLWLAMFAACNGFGVAEAQELAKVRNDYFCNPQQQYQPDDPWTRSRIWRRHTGHFGRYYNCDGEEQKRCSPYICWKHGDCPGTGESLRKSLDRTIGRVTQRIHDGNCTCGDGSCSGHRALSSTTATASTTTTAVPHLAEASITSKVQSRLQDFKGKKSSGDSITVPDRKRR